MSLEFWGNLGMGILVTATVAMFILFMIIIAQLLRDIWQP